MGKNEIYIYGVYTLQHEYLYTSAVKYNELQKCILIYIDRNDKDYFQPILIISDRYIQGGP